MAVDDSFTVALLHMDGTDASTTFTDESGKTWTARGNAQIDTAQSKFSGASGLFDGTGDYIDTPDNDDFTIGTNYTWDLWTRFAALPTSGNQQTIFSHGASGLYNLFWLDNNSGTYQWHFESWNGSTYAINFSVNAASLSINTWYHVALVKSGSNWYVFQDGTQCGSTTVDADTPYNPTSTFYIAQYWGGSRYFNGWMDEVRLSKDIARWTANFTPPTSAYAAGWANVAKINGIASASIAKVNGIAVASVSKVNGVAV